MALRTLMFAAVVAVAAGQNCMSFKTEKDCMDCEMVNDSMGMMKCKMAGMDMPMGDMCNGRDPCLSCEWTMNMCMPKSGGGSGNGGGMMMMGMQMWFYSSTKVTILFESWTTHDGGMYTLALILTCLGCFATMVLKNFLQEARDAHIALRAVLAFTYFNLSYAVMLIAMTYNVGLWFAAMIGMTAGYTVSEMRRARTCEGRKGYTDIEACH